MNETATFMQRTYRRLLRLYPSHIRTFYGDEMAVGFDSTLDKRRDLLARIRFLTLSIAALLTDATVQRLWTFGSHPSFSGRCSPDLGVVRPPNMGKSEWFQ
jgi:hypothetical protein